MITTLEGLSAEDQTKRTEMAWQSVASTEDGQIAIASLLEQLKLLDPLVTPEDVKSHNVAAAVLRMIGGDSTPRLIAALVTRRE